MQQPFHYQDGRRAMPGDTVRLHSGRVDGTILSLWFDPDDGTDATVVFSTPRIAPRRMNLATCMWVEEGSK